MFELRVVDRRKRIARIRIGTFVEDFALSMKSGTRIVEREWRCLLATLLGRKKKVALPVWRRGRAITRAWLLYRVGDVVFVRDRIFLRGFDPRKCAVPKRETTSEENRRVSEWSVDVADVAAFLQRPNHQPEPIRASAARRPSWLI